MHGGNIYETERKHKKQIIDFSANINPLGLPPRTKKVIYDNLDKILHYPDHKARNCTKKIARYWEIPEENILVGNGSIEFIYLVVSTFNPKTTFIPVPTFSEYERAAKNAKSKIQFLKLTEKEGFRLSLSGLSRPDIFFLCNPNNPTGNLVLENHHAIKQLANELVVVDEAFMDFLPDQKNYTLIWKAIQSKKIVVLRTLTKFFALPGLRMGYLIAHKEIINKLRQHQPPWSANSLAQLAAETILSDKEYINKTYYLIEEERRFLFAQLSRIEDLRPYPSVANYFLIKIEKAGMNSTSLAKRLIQEGFLIRDCSNFRNLNDKYIRIAIRSHRENSQFLAALRKIL